EPELKLKLKEKVAAYISRAEEVKKTIQQKQKDCKYHEHLDIADGETGYGYRKLFSRFLDDGRVTCVKIDDPYIRNSFQKFSHFCEILVGSASPVNRVILQTGVDCDCRWFSVWCGGTISQRRVGGGGDGSTEGNNKRLQQSKKFETLKQDLQLHKVDFTWNFSSLLHDRQIRFNNGWVVKIGRGLDYIKNAPHKFVGLGVHDFDFRPCLQTTIDIFYEGEPPL
ncbi:MIT domain-containing protein 1, partial [Taenia solium]